MQQSRMLEIQSNRIKWIDVLKGIGIVSVVWGHTGHPYAYLMFFFHMPLFFFISGYLYRYNENESWLNIIIKRLKHLLVPYSFYLIMITTVLYVLAALKDEPFTVTNVKALLLGGSLLEGPYGTFWFVTCLFTIQIVYDLLQRRLRHKSLIILFVIACYFFAYWESLYHQDFFFPGNMDVAFFGIVFYALGNLFKTKGWLENLRSFKVILISSALYFTYFYYLYFSQAMRFGMDLKHRQYYYFGTSILLPLCTIVLLIAISMGLAKWNLVRKAISSLGESSMSIMYLHLFSITIANQFITINPFRFMVIGILLPYMWYIFVSTIPGLRFLALGSHSKVSLNPASTTGSYNSHKF